jgi:hypothetical protein
MASYKPKSRLPLATRIYTKAGQSRLKELLLRCRPGQTIYTDFLAFLLFAPGVQLGYY